MKARRTTNLNQLALWGRYELEEWAMKGSAARPPRPPCRPFQTSA